MEDSIRKTVVRNVAEESRFTVNELDLVYRLFKVRYSISSLILKVDIVNISGQILFIYVYCPGFLFRLQELFDSNV